MKNQIKIVALLVAFAFSVVPILMAAEAGSASLPMQTLADYRKAYSGTKPVVAWNKYHEFRTLEKAPRPTLEPSRMRLEAVYGRIANGTKGIVGFLKKGEEGRKSLNDIYPSTIDYRPASQVSGTKDIVEFTR